MNTTHQFAVILALLFSIVSQNSALAWGKFGHVAICEIAYRNISDEARTSLNELLAADGEYPSFNRACLEEDDFPRPRPKDHFVNYPRSLKQIVDGECPGDNTCILAAIHNDTQMLANITKPVNERANVLIALGHRVGDVH